MPDNGGYHGRAARYMREWGAGVGDRLEIVWGATHSGILMPRYHHSDDAHIVIKLDSGYNVGIPVQGITDVRVSPAPPAPAPREAGPEPDPGLPDILLLSTGGTISSRIDYRTGAVRPALDAAQLGEAVPELNGIANISPRQVLSEYSENVTPDHWVQVASEIHRHGAKYAGVIVAHGTDTMHYTSAFLSLALAGFPVPIVMTGSQRSSDRASSDAAMNLAGAAAAITGGIPRGVYVAMHQDCNDGDVAVHLGTRVRKSHTSARGAFRTVDGSPAYVVRDGKLVPHDPPDDYYHGRTYEPRMRADPRVMLVKYHPGFDPSLLEAAVRSGCRAVIFEGTGLGHVGRGAYGTIRRMIQDGIFVGMASQCGSGRVRMTVYESGRDLLHMGIVPLGDMVPEVALVKAMWVLGNGLEPVSHAMTRSVASEVTW